MARSTTYRVDPLSLILIGLDTDDGPEHFLYQDRVKRKIPADQIETALQHGVGVIECAKLAGYDSPVVVSGRQQTKALRLANEKLAPKDRWQIEYKLVKGSPQDLMVYMIKENALRTDQTPLEKAQDSKKLQDNGATLEETAVAFGVSKQCIKDWNKVLEFEPVVLKAVRNGKISAYKALTEFRKTPPEKQEEKLEKVLAEVAPAPKVPGERAKPKRNMWKAIARYMADDPGTSLTKQVNYAFQFVHGTCSKAEFFREVTGGKASYDRAVRMLKKEEEE